MNYKVLYRDTLFFKCRQNFPVFMSSLIPLLLLGIFSVFSLTSPSLFTDMVHLSPAQCQLHYEIDALKLNRNSQTPKPLMKATFFSPPFLSVLAR